MRPKNMIRIRIRNTVYNIYIWLVQADPVPVPPVQEAADHEGGAQETLRQESRRPDQQQQQQQRWRSPFPRPEI